MPEATDATKKEPIVAKTPLTNPPPQVTQPAPQPPIERLEVLREDEDKKELRCQACGRHIATVITKHAVVSGTCGRKNCKKVNKFYIQGTKVQSEITEKFHKVAY